MKEGVSRTTWLWLPDCRGASVRLKGCIPGFVLELTSSQPFLWDCYNTKYKEFNMHFATQEYKITISESDGGQQLSQHTVGEESAKTL